MRGHFYIDPKAIAQDLGIEVISKARLDGDVNGYIAREDDGRVRIYYDSNMHPNRERFTIAHELGHYVKGHLKDKPLFRDPSKNFSLNNYDIYEVEANNFAANLLMPKEKIDFLLYDMGISSISEMAKLLKVSEAAMTYRLQNLGYIS